MSYKIVMKKLIKEYKEDYKDKKSIEDFLKSKIYVNNKFIKRTSKCDNILSKRNNYIYKCENKYIMKYLNIKNFYIEQL